MIKLQEQSEEFLKEVFTRYNPIDDVPHTLVGKFVIHMYAEEDTRREDGTLGGFYDSLFFRLDIYDLKYSYKYVVRNRDQISIEVPMFCRIFKDGSTVLFSQVEVQLNLWQSVDIVEPVDTECLGKN